LSSRNQLTLVGLERAELIRMVNVFAAGSVVNQRSRPPRFTRGVSSTNAVGVTSIAIAPNVDGSTTTDVWPAAMAATPDVSKLTRRRREGPTGTGVGLADDGCP